jgi:predicted peptidase
MEAHPMAHIKSGLTRIPSKRISVLSLALIGWILICSLWFEAQADTSLVEMQHKIADITLLKKQLGDRQQQAESALEALLKHSNDLLAEAHVLISSFKIKTLEDAQQNLRLRYDMQLLGTIAAYRQAFESKIHLYQTGQDKLIYLQQLAQDDTKMVAALNDFQVDALATQISLVINQYISEAHNIQIDTQTIEPVPPQKIWKNITDAKN